MHAPATTYTITWSCFVTCYRPVPIALGKHLHISNSHITQYIRPFWPDLSPQITDTSVLTCVPVSTGFFNRFSNRWFTFSEKNFSNDLRRKVQSTFKISNNSKHSSPIILVRFVCFAMNVLYEHQKKKMFSTFLLNHEKVSHTFLGKTTTTTWNDDTLQSIHRPSIYNIIYRG